MYVIDRKSLENTKFVYFLFLSSVLLLTQNNSFPVNGKLLVESEKSMYLPSRNDTVLKFMGDSQISSVVDEVSLAEVELYCSFLGNFSEFREWANATLIFPQAIHLQHCDYFRWVLLRSGGLQTICAEWKPNAYYNTTQTNPSAKNNNSVTNDPVVFLHFLTTESNNDVYPDFLTFYESSRQVVVITGNRAKDTVINQFLPEVNSNYKWTLASLTFNRNSGKDLETIGIEDIFGFATSSEPVVNPIGYWSYLEGFQIDRRKLRGLEDFQGRLIRITSVEGNPVVYLDRNSTTGKVKGRGYLPDILTSLSLFLNFKYELLEPKDRSFGSPDDSGNWSGMVGMLLRKEAEMALMSFSLTSQRKQVMGFSPPVEYSATRLLIRRDSEVTELKWESFVSPFHWKVWLAIPLMILLGVLTLMVLTHFNLVDSTPLNSACLLVCCFLNQGQDGHSYFRGLPSRIVLGSFWVLAVVIYASYTARLTSFLAATTETLPFNSLLEAVQNSHWKIGFAKGSSFVDRVRQAPEREMKLLSKKIEKDTSIFVTGFRDGVDRVFKDKYIFFTSDLVPSFMVKGNCSYAWLPGKYFPGFGYMGYQKNLPFASSISQKVAQIRESGQMRRLIKKWWGDEVSCSKGADAFAGMSLYETGTAFLIIIVGLSLAIFLFSIELLFRPKSDPSDSENLSTDTKSNNFVNSTQGGNLPELNTHSEIASNPRLAAAPNQNMFTFDQSGFYDPSSLDVSRKVDKQHHFPSFNRSQNNKN